MRKRSAIGIVASLLQYQDRLMSQFLCENKAVTAKLDRMKQLLEDEGGLLDPAMLINQVGDSLSITSSAAGDDKRTLISVPESCLVPFDALEVVVRNDRMLINSVVGQLSPTQVELAELMIDIYNQTDKLAHHRATHPLLCFAQEPEILAILAKLRPKYQEYLEDLSQGKTDSALLYSFFKSRTLNWGPGKNSEGVRVLMPFIDYANHHTTSPGFRFSTNNADQECIELINSKPLTESDECFVAYSPRYETMDTYLGYGFIDTESPHRYVRSVPVDITLANIGQLKTAAMPGQVFKGKLAPTNESLRQWLPRVQKKTEGSLTLSHLLMPIDGSMMALRRALGIFLRVLSPEVTRPILESGIKQAERHVINANIEYYTSLRQAAHSPESNNTIASALEELVKLCDLQLTRLDAYVEHHKLKLESIH